MVRGGGAGHDRGGQGIAVGVAVGVGVERGEHALVDVGVAVVVEAVAGGLHGLVSGVLSEIVGVGAVQPAGDAAAGLPGAGADAGLLRAQGGREAVVRGAGAVVVDPVADLGGGGVHVVAGVVAVGVVEDVVRGGGAGDDRGSGGVAVGVGVGVGVVRVQEPLVGVAVAVVVEVVAGALLELVGGIPREVIRVGAVQPAGDAAAGLPGAGADAGLLRAQGGREAVVRGAGAVVVDPVADLGGGGVHVVAGVVAVGVVEDVVRGRGAGGYRRCGGVAEGVAVGVGIVVGQEPFVGVAVAVVVEPVAGGFIGFVTRDRRIVRLRPAPDPVGVLGADLHGAGAHAGLHVRLRRFAPAHVLRVHLPAPVGLPAAAQSETDGKDQI